MWVDGKPMRTIWHSGEQGDIAIIDQTRLLHRREIAQLRDAAAARTIRAVLAACASIATFIGRRAGRVAVDPLAQIGEAPAPPLRRRCPSRPVARARYWSAACAA